MKRVVYIYVPKKKDIEMSGDLTYEIIEPYAERMDLTRQYAHDCQFQDFANSSHEDLSQQQHAESLWGSSTEGQSFNMEQVQQILLICRNKYREVHDIMFGTIGKVSNNENKFIQGSNIAPLETHHEMVFNWYRENIMRIIIKKMYRKKAYLDLLSTNHNIAGLNEIMVGRSLETDGIEPQWHNLSDLMAFYGKITRDLNILMELYNSKLNKIIVYIEEFTQIIEKIKVYRLLTEEITEFIIEPLEAQGFTESFKSYHQSVVRQQQRE